MASLASQEPLYIDICLLQQHVFALLQQALGSPSNPVLSKFDSRPHHPKTNCVRIVHIIELLPSSLPFFERGIMWVSSSSRFIKSTSRGHGRHSLSFVVIQLHLEDVVVEMLLKMPDRSDQQECLSFCQLWHSEKCQCFTLSHFSFSFKCRRSWVLHSLLRFMNSCSSLGQGYASSLRKDIMASSANSELMTSSARSSQNLP